MGARLRPHAPGVPGAAAPPQSPADPSVPIRAHRTLPNSRLQTRASRPPIRAKVDQTNIIPMSRAQARHQSEQGAQPSALPTTRAHTLAMALRIRQNSAQTQLNTQPHAQRTFARPPVAGRRSLNSILQPRTEPAGRAEPVVRPARVSSPVRSMREVFPASPASPTNDVAALRRSPPKHSRLLPGQQSHQHSSASTPASSPSGFPPTLSSTPLPQQSSPLDLSGAVDAKHERKLLDLEITNKSLLSINTSLEAVKVRQSREIRTLRRQLVHGRLAAAQGDDANTSLSDISAADASEDSLLAPYSENDAAALGFATIDKLAQQDIELERAHVRCRNMISYMIEEARTAMLTGADTVGGKVLHASELDTSIPTSPSDDMTDHDLHDEIDGTEDDKRYSPLQGQVHRMQMPYLAPDGTPDISVD